MKLKSEKIPIYTSTKQPGNTLNFAFIQTLHCVEVNTVFWVNSWNRFLCSFIIFKDTKKFWRSLLLLERSTFFPSSFHWFYWCSHKPAALLRDYKSLTSGLKTLAECRRVAAGPSESCTQTQRRRWTSSPVTVDVDGGRELVVVGPLSAHKTTSEHPLQLYASHAPKSSELGLEGNHLFIYFLGLLIFSSPWKLEQESVQVW